MKIKTLSILFAIISLLILTKTSSSFMIQTDIDDYTESSYNSLSDLNGYTLSTKNSSCTNGGVLTWDSDTETISLTTSSSDMCTVYLDKEPPVITSATISYNESELYLSDITFESDVQIEKYVLEFYDCDEYYTTIETQELNKTMSYINICYTVYVYVIDIYGNISNTTTATKEWTGTLTPETCPMCL